MTLALQQGLEGTEEGHDVLPGAGLAHEPDAPDPAGYLPESAADLDIVLIQERLAELRIIDALGDPAAFSIVRRWPSCA